MCEHPTDSFAALLDLARQGDTSAREALLKDHITGLTGYVRLQTGPLLLARESCSDIVQSVCRDLLQDLGDIRCSDPAAFRQWLYTTAHRKILYKARHHQAAMRDLRRESRSLEEDQALMTTYARFCSPSQAAEAQEECERIEAAFQELPDEYRDVIIQSRLVGQSSAEIAAASGRSEEAVRKLLSRARARLALLLNR